MKKNKTCVCHRLTSENMAGAGGPMGSDDTFINWTKFFKSISNAMKYAEKDYKKNKGKNKIKWVYDKEYDNITSGDLAFVMYTIDSIQTED